MVGGVRNYFCCWSLRNYLQGKSAVIIGVGTDIVQVERFNLVDRTINQIARNMLSEQELEDFYANNNKPAYLAKQFAAKEACIKATGVWASLSELQILRHPSGAPYVRSNYLDNYTIHISISDEKEYAVAFAIAEKEWNDLIFENGLNAMTLPVCLVTLASAEVY